jgi:hypothetical protein
MYNNYTTVAPGHLFQIVRTGDGPDYSETYSKTRYDQYPTTDSMSQLRYSLIERHIGPIKSICDFGYGNGSFLKYCHIEGLKTYGYDISNYELPSYVTRVDDPNNVEVDVMTFFDSMEHLNVEDLVPVLQAKKTKYFIISVPWYHESCGEEWFMNWKHRRENEHFHHFDSHGLIDLLINVGCKILHVGNDEDKIRTPFSDLPNILTIVAKKND